MGLKPTGCICNLSINKKGKSNDAQTLLLYKILEFYDFDHHKFLYLMTLKVT